MDLRRMPSRWGGALRRRGVAMLARFGLRRSAGGPPLPRLSRAVARARAEDLLRQLAVYRCREADKQRFGGEGDGGYVHLSAFAGVRAALSLGIGQEVSWDLAMAAHGLEVYQYDHTVAGPPVSSPAFHFRRLGVGPRDSEISTTLRAICAGLGEASADAILKIDIEGGEWDIFATCPDAVLGRFSQIICEFHGVADVADDAGFIRRMTALRRLTAHYAVVHIHPNNCGGVRRLGGVRVPEVLEVTFASRRLFSFAPTAEVFPTPLDRPNAAGNRDIRFDPVRGTTQIGAAAPP